MFCNSRAETLADNAPTVTPRVARPDVLPATIISVAISPAAVVPAVAAAPTAVLLAELISLS